MKKRKGILSVLLAVMLVAGVTACGSKKEDASAQKPEGEITADDISDTMESEDGKYVVAMVTDVAQLKDGNFNEGTWNGVKCFASALTMHKTT